MERFIYQKQVSGLPAFPGHFHEGALFDKDLRAEEKTETTRGKVSSNPLGTVPQTDVSPAQLSNAGFLFIT